MYIWFPRTSKIPTLSVRCPFGGGGGCGGIADAPTSCKFRRSCADCLCLPSIQSSRLSGCALPQTHMGLYNNPACLRYVRSVLRERLTCKTIRSKKKIRFSFVVADKRRIYIYKVVF